VPRGGLWTRLAPCGLWRTSSQAPGPSSDPQLHICTFAPPPPPLAARNRNRHAGSDQEKRHNLPNAAHPFSSPPLYLCPVMHVLYYCTHTRFHLHTHQTRASLILSSSRSALWWYRGRHNGLRSMFWNTIYDATIRSSRNRRDRNPENNNHDKTNDEMNDHHSKRTLGPASKLQNVSLPLPCASWMENVGNYVPLGRSQPRSDGPTCWFSVRETFAKENAIPRLNITAVLSPLSTNHARHAAVRHKRYVVGPASRYPQSAGRLSVCEAAGNAACSKGPEARSRAHVERLHGNATAESMRVEILIVACLIQSAPAIASFSSSTRRDPNALPS
jgi:hypothetical protein